MRKIIYLPLLLVCVFVACTNKEERPSTYVGTWCSENNNWVIQLTDEDAEDGGYIAHVLVEDGMQTRFEEYQSNWDIGWRFGVPGVWVQDNPRNYYFISYYGDLYHTSSIAWEKADSLGKIYHKE